MKSVLAACVVLILSACAPLAQSSTADSAEASPSASAGSPYGGATAVIDVASGPRGVAFAAGSVWVASTIGGVVQRVDPATNAVIAEIQVERPVTLVTLDGELWASVLNGDPSSDDEVVRIDTAADTVAERIAVPVFHNIAAGAVAIWTVDGVGELRRIDPRTGDVMSFGSAGGITIGIAANDEAVWGIREDGAAWRIPASGGPLVEASLGVAVPGRSRVAVGSGTGGKVWVAVPGTVLALDPTDLTVVTSTPLAGMELVNDLWVSETDVWLSANVTDAGLGLDGGSVLQLDPESGEVGAAFRLGPESSGVLAEADSLWAVDQADDRLVRFQLTD